MTLFGLPIDQTIIFFTLMIIVGIIETVSGGGALIIVPLLLSIDVDYVDAMFTVKIIGIILFVFLTFYFHKKNVIDIKKSMPLFIFSFIGGAIGGYFLTIIDPKQLEIIVPFVIAVILLYFAFDPKKNVKSRTSPKLSIIKYSVLCCIPIGIYDGFLGPASGSMFIATLIAFYGMNVKKVAVLSKFLNMGTMSGTIITLGGAGSHFLINIGILQIISMGIGTIIGANLVLRKGEKVIRPLVIVISATMLINLIYQNLFNS